MNRWKTYTESRDYDDNIFYYAHYINNINCVLNAQHKGTTDSVHYGILYSICTRVHDFCSKYDNLY